MYFHFGYAYSSSFAYSQNTFKAIIKDGKTNEILVGATAQLINTQKGGTANENGYLEIQNIPNGTQQIKFSYLGYETKIDSFTFPMSDTCKLV
ncbi:MAG: carboxypeptidase-like regulatory domain-containing protein [Saprospiraceae bacterium]|nr:carboxypeptidase-like regulatory domain-containing protein [Saprospiraceae bacterium]